MEKFGGRTYPRLLGLNLVIVDQSSLFKTIHLFQSNLRTVIEIVITSNLELARSPGNVFLPSRQTGLPKDSVANVSQVLTIDKCFLTERIGFIPGDLQDEIDEGLRMILYL